MNPQTVLRPSWRRRRSKGFCGAGVAARSGKGTTLRAWWARVVVGAGVRRGRGMIWAVVARGSRALSRRMAVGGGSRSKKSALMVPRCDTAKASRHAAADVCVYVLGGQPSCSVGDRGASAQSLSQAIARQDGWRVRGGKRDDERMRQNFPTESGATTRFGSRRRSPGTSTKRGQKEISARNGTGHGGGKRESVEREPGLGSWQGPPTPPSGVPVAMRLQRQQQQGWEAGTTAAQATMDGQGP